MPITESSLLRISYGALAFAACTLIGFTMWLSAINEKAQANVIQIKEMREDKRVELQLLREVRGRVAKMEGILEAMMLQEKQEE